MGTCKRSWVDEPAAEQQMEQAKERKAPPEPKRHKQNDYRAQDSTIDVVAELLEVERYPLCS